MKYIYCKIYLILCLFLVSCNDRPDNAKNTETIMEQANSIKQETNVAFSDDFKETHNEHFDRLRWDIDDDFSLSVAVEKKIPFDALNSSPPKYSFLKNINKEMGYLSQKPDVNYLKFLGLPTSNFALPKSGSYLNILWGRIITVLYHTQVFLRHINPDFVVEKKGHLAIVVTYEDEQTTDGIVSLKRYHGFYDKHTESILLKFDVAAFENAIISRIDHQELNIRQYMEKNQIKNKPFYDQFLEYAFFRIYIEENHYKINRMIFDVLTHEAVHYYLGKINKGSTWPPWFEEGLALLCSNYIDELYQSMVYLILDDAESDKFRQAVGYSQASTALIWSSDSVRSWAENKIQNERELRVGLPARSYFRYLLEQRLKKKSLIPFTELISYNSESFNSDSKYKSAYSEAFWFALFSLQNYGNSNNYSVPNSKQLYFKLAKLKDYSGMNSEFTSFVQKAESVLLALLDRALDPTSSNIGFDAYTDKIYRLGRDVSGVEGPESKYMK